MTTYKTLNNITYSTKTPKNLINMKNSIISLYFRIGVDVLGFPLIWRHMIFRQQNNLCLGIKQTVNVSQLLIKLL